MVQILICAGILQYDDEDSDKVVLESDSDLQAAVDHARLAGWKVSIIFVLVPSFVFKLLW